MSPRPKTTDAEVLIETQLFKFISFLFVSKVFKWSGTAWVYQLNFTHGHDVNVVIFLSTGQVASGSSDDTVQVWSYSSGTSAQNCSASEDVRGLDQIASNLLAIGQNDDNILICCFTNNTIVKTINANGQTRAIQVLTSSKIVAGTDSHVTLIIDWTSSNMNSYSQYNHNIDGVAVTSGMLVVSISDSSAFTAVRNVTGLDISAGNSVCTQTFSDNLKSIVAKDSNQIGKLILISRFMQVYILKCSRFYFDNHVKFRYIMRLGLVSY